MKDQILGVGATILIISMAFFLLFVAGCMKDPEVCNYDGQCSNDETDNCADCQSVLGRDVNPPAAQANSPELNAQETQTVASSP